MASKHRGLMKESRAEAFLPCAYNIKKLAANNLFSQGIFYMKNFYVAKCKLEGIEYIIRSSLSKCALSSQVVHQYEFYINNPYSAMAWSNQDIVTAEIFRGTFERIR